MRRVSRGSGERCSTHRQCSRKSPLSAQQLRVARLSQPAQNATRGSQAARELRPARSTGSARAPATSRRACRAAFTCRLPTSKPRPGIAPGRYGAPHRRAFVETSASQVFRCGGATLCEVQDQGGSVVLGDQIKKKCLRYILGYTHSRSN